MITETIFVQLMEEELGTYRPTKGVLIKDKIYVLLPTKDYDPEDEKWEFLPGSIVECKKHKVCGGEKIDLAYRVAVELGLKTEDILIRQLGANADAFRGTKGLLVKDNIFKVLPTENYDTKVDNWEFPPGATVVCEKRKPSDNELVAVRLASEDGLAPD